MLMEALKQVHAVSKGTRQIGGCFMRRRGAGNKGRTSSGASATVILGQQILVSKVNLTL